MSDQENLNNNNNQVETPEIKIEGSDNKSYHSNKKIILAIIIGIFSLILCFGIITKKEPLQNQRKVPESQYTTTKTIEHPIIGTWQHPDIPGYSYYKEWKITFKPDGTYTSESIGHYPISSASKNYDDIIKSSEYNKDMGKIYLADIFGKGTFKIDEETNVLTFIDETKPRTFHKKIKILIENEKEILKFKNEYNGTFDEESIFIKQE